MKSNYRDTNSRGPLLNFLEPIGELLLKGPDRYAARMDATQRWLGNESVRLNLKRVPIDLRGLGDANENALAGMEQVIYLSKAGNEKQNALRKEFQKGLRSALVSLSRTHTPLKYLELLPITPLSDDVAPDPPPARHLGQAGISPNSA